MLNARELAQHVRHEIRVVLYASESHTYDTSIVCEDCAEVLHDAEWSEEDD